MKSFEKPMIEVVQFEENDIITTSTSCWDNSLFSSETCSSGNVQFKER